MTPAEIGLVVVIVLLVVALVAVGVTKNAWDKTVTKSPTYDSCADPKCACRKAPCRDCGAPEWAHDVVDGVMECPPGGRVWPTHPWPRAQPKRLTVDEWRRERETKVTRSTYEMEEDDVG